MDARTVIIRPVISEKSYSLIGDGKYTFRVHDRAHKTQIAHAVEQIFDVNVVAVRTATVRAKPKRRGLNNGRTRNWRKATRSWHSRRWCGEFPNRSERSSATFRRASSGASSRCST